MKKSLLLLVVYALLFVSFDVTTFHFANPQDALQFLGNRSFSLNSQMMQKLKTIAKSLELLPEDYHLLSEQKAIHQKILQKIDESIQLKDANLRLADQNIALLQESETVQEEILSLQTQLLHLQEKSLQLSEQGLQKTETLYQMGRESLELGEKSAELSQEMTTTLKRAFGLL